MIRPRFFNCATIFFKGEKNMKKILSTQVLLVVVLLLAGLPLQPAFAVGVNRYVVTTGADTGTCTSASPCLTVAYAITQSNSGDTIHIAAGAYPANLTVDKDLTFIGAGMNQTLLNGSGAGTVMLIPGAATVINITDLAIANGNGEYGGGINNYGKLSLTRVKVTDNIAAYGGGINSTGQISMTDSVVRANTANIGGGLSISVNSPTVNTFTRVTISGNNITTGYGAGIQIQGTGSMVLTNVTISENAIGSGYAGGVVNAGTMIYIVNSTIAYNQSDGATGGGIRNSSGIINIQNTIVANNGSKNCSGSLASFGNNLDSLNDCNFIQPTDLRNTDPYLEPLADNGGFTQTHALTDATPLHPQSPAIDAATSCPTTDDQRGISRPQGAYCDIGSYEKIVMLTLNLKSTGTQDGWVLESAHASKVGGSLDSASTTFRLGDDAAKKQYRGILSFSTGGSLPDDAVITSVTLKVRKQNILGGGNPVTLFQGFMVDIKKGFFGTAALQATDFQAAAHKTYGPFVTALSGGWYSIDLTPGKGYINKMSTLSGLTQIRLRFKLDDNGNAIANYLSLFSGNAPAASRPQLIIQYYAP
jgi:hypothetical protein